MTKTGGTISFDNVSWSLLENTNFTSNLNIIGNLNLINKKTNNVNILHYDENTKEINPINLQSYTSSTNTNKFEWLQDNHNLKLNIMM